MIVDLSLQSMPAQRSSGARFALSKSDKPERSRARTAGCGWTRRFKGGVWRYVSTDPRSRTNYLDNTYCKFLCYIKYEMKLFKDRMMSGVPQPYDHVTLNANIGSHL